MSTPSLTREQWLETLRRVQPVGECLEWQGRFMGSTPIVYCPAGFHTAGLRGGNQSVRSVLWSLQNGEAPKDQVIRPTCGNWRCVRPDHWLVIDRKRQAKEQARRGELQTTNRKVTARKNARKRGKLTMEIADQIRFSSEPTKALSDRHGVSKSTITAVKRGDLWSPVVRGAWVFGRVA